jgi:hypothetical protein
MKWAAKIKIICFGPPGLPSLDSSLGIAIYKSVSVFGLCLYVSGSGKKERRNQE